MFLTKLLKANSFESVYPELSANTVKILKAKSPESRRRAFKMMKLGAAMGSSTPMKLKESKIGAKQAAITLVGDKSTQKTKSGGTVTTSSSMEFEFLKESGQWKVDLSEKVSRM